MANRYQWPIAVAIAYAVFAAPIPMGVASASPSLMSYGLGEGITEGQAVAIDNLAWPQSYGAIINLLGYPDLRDESADWYKAPNGQMLRIYYSGTTATGYNWSNQPW